MADETVSNQKFNYQLLTDWGRYLKRSDERGIAMLSISKDGRVAIQCVSEVSKAQMAKLLQDLAAELKKNSNITEN